MSAETVHHVSADEFAGEVWEDESPAGLLPDPDRRRHPRMQKLPVGIDARGWRRERDSLGEILVPAMHYWGAQTQRSLEHFPIGTERMPIELIRAYAQVKAAAAQANAELGQLPRWQAEAIVTACREIERGLLDGEFPLTVFQAGSGTHTNANLNEVIANRANQLLGGRLGSGNPIHPSDGVNASQSTNDTFVTAMHVAAVELLHSTTLPALSSLIRELEHKAAQWAGIAKPGRTHLMDATSLTIGQEWSGYAASLDAARRQLIAASHDLFELALGGTAVGTGQNAPDGFGERAIALLAERSGYPYRRAANPFAAQSTVDAIVRTHSALKGVAVTLYKIANDLRWLGSGPQHGLHELVIPELEAGSSIMPGKVNPTQAEALMMVCLQVIGADVTVTMAGAEGNFELNAFRPVVIANFVRSARLLADSSRCLGRLMVRDLRVDERLMQHSGDLDAVSLATALTRHVGYTRAADIARSAAEHGTDVLTEARRSGVDVAALEEVRHTVQALHPRIPAKSA